MTKCLAVLTALLFTTLFAAGQQTNQVKLSANLRSGWKLAGDELSILQNHNLLPNTGFGVWFNDVRGGFLDGSSWIFGSTYDVINGHGNELGYCVGTDGDGDQIFTSLSSEGPKDGADIVGLHKITGGTGKYLGVEGDITARCTIQTQFHQLVCSNVASYTRR